MPMFESSLNISFAVEGYGNIERLSICVAEEEEAVRQMLLGYFSLLRAHLHIYFNGNNTLHETSSSVLRKATSL